MLSSVTVLAQMLGLMLALCCGKDPQASSQADLPSAAAPQASAFATQQELAPVELKDYTNPEDIYQVTVFQLALMEQNFKVAAPIALSLAQAKHSIYMARQASFLYTLLDDRRNALKAASLWQSLDADSEQAQFNYLFLAARAGHYEGLIKKLQNHIKQGQLTKSLYEVATFISQLRDPSLSLNIYNAVIKDLPPDPLLFLVQHDFAMRANDFDLARDASQKALTGPTATTAMLQLLELSRDRPDRFQVLSRFQAVIAKQPEIIETRYAYIEELLYDKHYNSAVKEMQELVRLNPDNYNLKTVMAFVYAEAGQYDQAVAQLNDFQKDVKQLAQEQPDSEEVQLDAQHQLDMANLQLGQVYLNSGEYAKGIQVLNKVVDFNKRNGVRILQAQLYSKLKAYAKAFELLSNIQADDPEYVRALLLSAQLHQELQQWPQSLKVLERAQKADRNNVFVKYFLALNYEKLGQLDKSEAMVLDLIQEHPDASEGYNALGYTLTNHSTKLSFSNELLKRALAIEPQSAYIQDSYGWLQFKMGNPQLALHYMQLAWQQEPLAEVAAHMAEVLFAIGRKKEARDYLHQGYQLDRSDPTLLDTAKRLHIKLAK